MTSSESAGVLHPAPVARTIVLADDRKADVLDRLLFIHTDDLLLRPSWWEVGGASAPKDRCLQEDGLDRLDKAGTLCRRIWMIEVPEPLPSLSIPSAIDQLRGRNTFRIGTSPISSRSIDEDGLR